MSQFQKSVRYRTWFVAKKNTLSQWNGTTKTANLFIYNYLSNVGTIIDKSAHCQHTSKPLES
jgi:hypothetical protein